MAEHVIKLPDVGEGVAEAELVEWNVKVGDVVREDATLGAVMTDKATVEIPSPVAGEVLWLGGEVGDIIAVGSDLVRLKVAGEDRPAAAVPRQKPATQQRRAEPAAPAPAAPRPAGPAGCARRTLFAHPLTPRRAASGRGETPGGASGSASCARGRDRSPTSAWHRPRRTHHARGSRRLHRARPNALGET